MPQDLKDPKVIRAQLVHKVRRAIRVHREQLAPKVRKGNKESKEKQGLPEQQVLKVRKVRKAR